MNLIKLSILLVPILLDSCTYNISMAHTQGMADDVIDETSTNTPNISPNLNIPLTPKI